MHLSPPSVHASCRLFAIETSAESSPDRNLKLHAHSKVFRVPSLLRGSSHPGGCSPQAASPATRKAEGQGRSGEKK